MTQNNETLKQFLKDHNACPEGYYFAKDLTLEQFLNTCNRGDWILWLFKKMQPLKDREIVLAGGHCVNTVRHLMKDECSTKAVDADDVDAADAARKKNQKQTADICRKYLPLEIWGDL